MVISNLLIMNKDMIFETTVAKVVQPARKVPQMTKNLCYVELSQNRYSANFKDADYEYGHDF